MAQWLALLGDIGVIIFDLLLYSQMTVLRKDTPRSRGILLAGCCVIVGFYFAAVYVFSWPVAIAAFGCMTLPSLALFWTLCKYRDARFFLTFCFVDTLSLVVGFVIRFIGVRFGELGSAVAIGAMLAGFVLLYRVGRPYFKKYRELLEFIHTGWKRLTLSVAIIYVTMILVASYPKPLIERPEYHLPYLMVCLMVLSFYLVMFTNLTVTGQVYEQSKKLQEQQKWFKMAYVDALTEIPNRMAYMENTHKWEQDKDGAPALAVVVMDLNHFKQINDTRGHSTGDQVLKHAAERMNGAFSQGDSRVYRIGGDEFAALTVGLSENAIQEKLKGLEKGQCGEVDYTISYGYAFVDSTEKNAVEQAFSRADRMMYSNKHQEGQA